MKYSTLLSTKQLENHLNDPGWVIVDCRFALDDTEKGRRDYLEAHIPGAVYAHLDDDLSGPVEMGVTGRHPLPAIDRMVEVFSCWGIHEDIQVVAYDDAGGALGAGRLWWMLRYLGHENAAVLDGGWAKWRSFDYPVRSGVEENKRTIFVPQTARDVSVSAEQVDALRTDPQYLVMDARARERYLGIVEPIDPVGGHIPGAVSAPYLDQLNADGEFRAVEELRDRFRTILGEVNPRNVIHYCGSGVTASANILAMEAAGLKGSKLYPGSWSEWITDPGRPVE